MKTYITDNEEIPLGYDRVTEILSPYKRFDGVDPKVLSNACERGSIVHNFCELYARNLLIETPREDVKLYFESFRKWFDLYVDEVVECEMRINDPDLKISGKFDLLCKMKFDDGLVIVDYKTPLNFDKTWELQMAAYDYLIRQNTKYTPNRCLCLKLDDDGNMPIAREYKHLYELTGLFLKQVDVYRFFNKKIDCTK